MSSGKLISELQPGDLVILKGRRQKDRSTPAIITKVLDPDVQNLMETTIWTTFKYEVYVNGKTIYVTEGHIARVLSDNNKGNLS